MSERLTGIEAYRVLKLCLEKWFEIIKVERNAPPERWTRCSDYIEWLISMLGADPALMADWEESIKEAIEERAEYGNALHAFKARGGVYRPCKCQNEDMKVDADVSNELRNIPR
jgi:hypothetical protein